MPEAAKHTDVYIGKKGVGASWQDEWPETAACVHCGQDAELLVTVMESKGGKASACHLHENDPQGEGYWPHDSIAVATYLCRRCFKVTSFINQA